MCRSLEREAHYVDLEAQPVTGPGQTDLRHLLPAGASAKTSGSSATSTSQGEVDAEAYAKIYHSNTVLSVA